MWPTTASTTAPHVQRYVPISRRAHKQGYLEDYKTVEERSPPLNASGKADLYAELASGAESGWDYTVRWVKYPVLNKTNDDETLRGLNIRSIIPVDLNSLLAGDHALVSVVRLVRQRLPLMTGRRHVQPLLQLV